MENKFVLYNKKEKYWLGFDMYGDIEKLEKYTNAYVIGVHSHIDLILNKYHLNKSDFELFTLHTFAQPHSWNEEFKVEI